MNPPSLFGTPPCQLGVPNLTDDSPFIALLRRRLADHSVEAAVSFDDMWCHVRPVGATHPAQGWKLHLSATAEAAPHTLTVALDVLLSSRHAFKFASTPGRLNLLNSANYPRPGAGKFVTIYPTDVDALGAILRDLGELLEGEPGPYILSDLRWNDLVGAEESVAALERRGCFVLW